MKHFASVFYRISPDARIWIEQQVESSPDLVDYQLQLAAKIPGFVPADPSDLHVTYLHLGKPRQLHQELAAAGSRFSYDQFVNALQPLLQRAAQAINFQVHADTRDLAVFGPDSSPMVVARLNLDPELIKRHRLSEGALHYFIRRVGVEDFLKFTRTSPNLHFCIGDSYHPHVTLGTVPPGTNVVGLELPPLRLVLNPTRLRGAERI